ncbi:MAG: hypothetical protein DWQ31_07475 [Planctomycetota bacterium]|nr:MAG: hypothetical protein DWQ31_07475 [Planctomycetota bacterium]REJ96354.1 MAG: hypothetical protein DWQ35_04690 [Planctomycetota bacterium]REK31469.1 MAG: hypothetical protein DWQ42_00650 [Planctomycetota bacterium]REK40699.1 MAG: hypothetical protein DWQ46_15790 [Planctomycetota bacterium]
MHPAAERQSNSSTWARRCEARTTALPDRRLGRALTIGLLISFLGLWLALSSSPASGQRFVGPRSSERFELSTAVQIEDDDIQKARPHLARAEALLQNSSWDDAIETLGLLIDQHGSRVVQVADRRYLSIRELCHRQLARLPASALALYRERVDPTAEQWYREGLAARDAAPLEQLVRLRFCSSYGDDALDMLAQLALERGEFARARQYWQQISPLLRLVDGQTVWVGLAGYDLAQDWDELRSQFGERDAAPTWLAYPGTDLDVASIRARLVLTSILEGSRERARLELDVFRRLHGEAAGRLAGRSGPYAKTLAALLRESETWKLPDDTGEQTRVAGSPFGVRSRRGRRLAGENPIWIRPLTHQGDLSPPSNPLGSRFGRSFSASRAERFFVFHPLTVGPYIFFNNQRDVFALRSLDGKPAWSSGLGSIHNLEEANPVRTSASPGSQSLDAACFAMTTRGNRIYARIGARSLPTEGAPVSQKYSSFVVCLGIEREGEQVWQVPRRDKVSRFLSEKWSFEGPPVADDKYAYVGMRRGDLWSEAFVACLDGQTGELRWRTKICAAGSVQKTANNLLTLHQGTLYYNTNLGAIAALDAATGEIRWVYRYERADGGRWSRPPAHFFRKLNPCLIHDGLVIVDPLDSEYIVALDATTGERVWQSVPIISRHLLGVGQGNLIATGRSVWWFNARTGKLEAEWSGKDNRNSPRGAGRGILYGTVIYWPTPENIQVLDQKLGPNRLPVPRPQLTLKQDGLGGGNLAVTAQALLLATDDKLVAFPWLDSDEPAP